MMAIMISFWVLIYLGIGLLIYFTLPNRKGIPVSISLPFVIAWFALAIVFLYTSGKDEKPKKERG